MSTQRTVKTSIGLRDAKTGNMELVVEEDFTAVAGYNPFGDEKPHASAHDLIAANALKIEILKDKLRFWVTRGILSPNIILKKVYNADQEDELSKQAIINAFNDVLAELKQDIKSRDIGIHFLTRISEFDELKFKAYQLLDNPHIRHADQLAAINTINGLSKDQLNYFERLGLSVTLKADPENKNSTSILDGDAPKIDERSVTELDRIRALNAQADAIEVDYEVK